MGCWVCAFLYLTYFYGENKIDSPTIYSFLGVLHVIFASCLLEFLRLIKPEYRSSFYSTQSGRQATVAYFNNVEDAARIVIFANNMDLWRDIAPAVKEWTLANWSRWEAEKPEWFTAAFKESVPDDMMPKEALDELNNKAGGARRRSSVGIYEIRRSLIDAENNAIASRASVAVADIA